MSQLIVPSMPFGSWHSFSFNVGVELLFVGGISGLGSTDCGVVCGIGWGVMSGR